jgi:hypothetical protein
MRVKALEIGTRWMDDKGQTWEVKRMLPYGRYEVVTVDRKRTAEMRGEEIQAAIERQRLR